MLNQYEPNVKVTIAFLKLIGVKVNNRTVNETLQNHPDWPSLLCITDSLNKWNVPNAAGKIEPERIDDLPSPFIAYIYERESPFAIVKAVTDTTVSLYRKNYNKLQVQPKADFLKSWNGVYVIAEPDEHSGEANYAVNKQNIFYNTLIPFAAITAILGLSLFLLYDTTGALAGGTIGSYLQYLIFLAGTTVTTLLLWYEIDKNNPILQKVCTGIAKGNCNAILTGKAAKVFNWLSWSEVGFFYFTGNLLALLFVPNAITIIAWLNLLALPYTVFSIYYQWRVAKQWCVLCLAVQALLLLGAANIFGNQLLQLPRYSFLLYALSLLLFSLPAYIWFAIKPYFLRLQQAKNTKREYLRLKFNREIFNTLLKKQKQITLSTDGLGIDIGNPDAANTIVKVCNPYCGPCATVHPKLEKILDSNKNIKAKIIFTTPNDESHPSIKPVKHFLAIATESNREKIKQALDDWYLPQIKDYDTFAAKYDQNGEFEMQGNKLEMMDKWCRETGIDFTPTFFINGRQLPNLYSIEDLQYFLLE